MRDASWVKCPECFGVVKTPGEERISTPLFIATCPHCGLDFDWRLSYGKDFLRGATLAWERYVPSDAWNHDHCALCLQKFMEECVSGVENAGYVTFTPAATWWICQRCFEDFHDEMGWRVKRPDEPSDEPA